MTAMFCQLVIKKIIYAITKTIKIVIQGPTLSSDEADFQLFSIMCHMIFNHTIQFQITKTKGLKFCVSWYGNSVKCYSDNEKIKV